MNINREKRLSLECSAWDTGEGSDGLAMGAMSSAFLPS